MPAAGCWESVFSKLLKTEVYIEAMLFITRYLQIVMMLRFSTLVCLLPYNLIKMKKLVFCPRFIHESLSNKQDQAH